MELSDLDGSLSYEKLNDISDVFSDADNRLSTESTSEFVSGATVNLETLPGNNLTVQVQKDAVLLKCEEAAEAALVNVNHASTDDFDVEMNEFKKTTLFSSKYYKVYVRMVQPDKVHHLVT